MAGVSGGAAILNDYGSATKSRLPLVIGAIVLITFLMLVAILRAPLLALSRSSSTSPRSPPRSASSA